MSEVFKLILDGDEYIKVIVAPRDPDGGEHPEDARVIIYSKDVDGDMTEICLTQAQARELAIAILNKAKEIES